jgi:CRISPR-associated endonuclease/helicase Cas3
LEGGADTLLSIWFLFCGGKMEIKDRRVTSLWAKKEERASQFYWLPLTTHLTDTMNVCKWLWNNWISDSQRDFCIHSIRPCDAETASNLAAFLGAVHDLGKATPAFQIQKGYSNSPDLDDVLLERLEQNGIRGISTLILADPHRSHHTIAGEFILSHEFSVHDDIGSIIGGHHGKPVDDKLIIEDQSAYEANYFQSEDCNSEIYKEWKSIHQAIVQWALQVSGFASIDALPEISKPAQALYSGILIMADWIASNSEYFPLVSVDPEQGIDCAQRYRHGISLWRKNIPLQLQSYPSADDLFRSRFGFLPRDFQKITCNTISHIDHPGIIILEAPMGLGKTETALAAAEEVAVKTGSSGLFFGLPTQATSNSMFGRVKQWLERLAEEYGEKQSLRLCHGKAALNDEMNSLSVASSIDVDGEDHGSVFVNEWFSGRKKSSLDDFVVGTVDGFLLTALKQKHLALRHLGFSKKVVIIDEVHAYDTYMQQYLKEAIQWMGAYRTPVILASATLPQERRKDLISAYLKGMGLKKKDIEFPEKISGNEYPMVSYTDGKTVRVQTDFPAMQEKYVCIHKLSEEELLEKTADLLDGGGIVGIIVNTVRRAQQLGKLCKENFGDDIVEVLHSSFIATDRLEKESQLMDMIGKHGKRPEKKIIIGTQVIEQSLDIDFDVLITDLCPIDLLIQRIGRLHRHEIRRPEKHRKPVVYVMGVNDRLEFERGSEHIYGKYLLARTQYFLKKGIKIPIDIPVLVNDVYGDAVPEFPEELQRVYQKSREEMEAFKQQKKDTALTYRIESPYRKKNLIGWLKDPDCSKSDEMAAAQVRDIQETIEIIAVKQMGNGYGIFSGGRDISGRIEEPEIAKELAKQTIRLPNYVTVRKGVRRTIEYLEEYNLEYLRNWQEQPWLKGSLGVIFDEEGKFDFNGITLCYDNEFGLREEKRNEQI